MPTLRDMTEADVPAVRELVRQLGYELTDGEVMRRFRAVSRKWDHQAAVVEDDDTGAVVAFVHVYARPAIEKPPEAMLQAIVVDENHRGAGLGTAIVDWAESWARDRGYASIALHTGLQRADAHIFYHRLGYHAETESRLMRKPLAPK